MENDHEDLERSLNPPPSGDYHSLHHQGRPFRRHMPEKGKKKGSLPDEDRGSPICKRTTSIQKTQRNTIVSMEKRIDPQIAMPKGLLYLKQDS